MSDAISWKYPEYLVDDEGYPTEEALDYIRNWQISGQYFAKNMYRELIDYIKSIWTYNDTIEEENGLLEIHTYGWSGNEMIIEELGKTDLWLLRFRAHLTGGHYYFKMDTDSEYDWHIVKSKDK